MAVAAVSGYILELAVFAGFVSRMAFFRHDGWLLCLGIGPAAGFAPVRFGSAAEWIKKHPFSVLSLPVSGKLSLLPEYPWFVSGVVRRFCLLVQQKMPSQRKGFMDSPSKKAWEVIWTDGCALGESFLNKCPESILRIQGIVLM